MKIRFLCYFSITALLLCVVPQTRCYVHNDVMKFGEENSLKCSQGNLYILHCEVKCMNRNNKMIYKSCMNEVEERCLGNNKCKYYFDYIIKNRKQSFRNKNEIEIGECVESEKNIIKTSTTCLLSDSFLLDEAYVQYFFFIKNKNDEPIMCKNGKLNINSALLHSPFCKINLKDVTEFLKKKCDNNKECVINPYELQKNALNEKDPCYINNSYISLNVVCTTEKEEEVSENKQKHQQYDDDDAVEYNEEYNNNYSIDNHHGFLNEDENNSGGKYLNSNDEVDHIMNSNGNYPTKIKKAKMLLLNKLNEQLVKKNLIFQEIGEILSHLLKKRYDASDLKDLFEDRYNEMRKSTDADVYTLYVLETLVNNQMEEGIVVTDLQEKLEIILKEQMDKLNEVEKAINHVRKRYFNLYNEARKKDMKELFDENDDPILTYDDFAHGNGIISADIFFKYKPTLKALNFNKFHLKDKKGKANKKNYSDLIEIDRLDEYNRKKRIMDMRNILVEKLKNLYYDKNGIFNKIASCIKSYCYKKPLNVHNLSNVLKRNYENLKENKTKDPMMLIISYLEKVDNHDELRATSEIDDDKHMHFLPWEKNKRILQKLKTLLYIGYQQVYDKDIEIKEKIEKYMALNDKAKEYNLHRLFNESDEFLKKVFITSHYNESADEVFGNQASFFDVYKREEDTSGNENSGEDGGDKSDKMSNAEKFGDINAAQFDNHKKGIAHSQTQDSKSKKVKKEMMSKDDPLDDDDDDDDYDFDYDFDGDFNGVDDDHMGKEKDMNNIDEGYGSAEEDNENEAHDDGNEVDSISVEDTDAAHMENNKEGILGDEMENMMADDNKHVEEQDKAADKDDEVVDDKDGEVVDDKEADKVGEVVDDKEADKVGEVVDDKEADKVGEVVDDKDGEVVDDKEADKVGEVVDDKEADKVGEVVADKVGEVVDDKEADKVGEVVADKVGEVVDDKEADKVGEVVDDKEADKDDGVVDKAADKEADKVGEVVDDKEADKDDGVVDKAADKEADKVGEVVADKVGEVVDDKEADKVGEVVADKVGEVVDDKEADNKVDKAADNEANKEADKEAKKGDDVVDDKAADKDGEVVDDKEADKDGEVVDDKDGEVVDDKDGEVVDDKEADKAANKEAVAEVDNEDNKEVVEIEEEDQEILGQEEEQEEPGKGKENQGKPNGQILNQDAINVGNNNSGSFALNLRKTFLAIVAILSVGFFL
ncbi:surface protein P113 [Plasmodium gonderi]|uniref:Surface protein P113 n=1 Tax=Plasmodium gonderi TaxID=77519 RepID=A0A1Y1JST7_PLAGO|nr:surface protein P113 [Plasmodium gonderi]GAW83014.1 surface protein P113 [Plasmodium gonderi]